MTDSFPAMCFINDQILYHCERLIAVHYISTKRNQHGSLGVSVDLADEESRTRIFRNQLNLSRCNVNVFVIYQLAV